jgi:sialate O-acetylesterase
VALARTYGQKIPYSGPIYKGHTVEGNRLRITFDHAENGLFYGVKEGLKPAEPVAAGAIHWFRDENGKVTSSARGELNSILIAGADKNWVPAATVIDGSTLVVFSPQVPNPVAVRYAYVQDPSTAPLGINCLLYNKEGLPASPFRTDGW